ncbi:PP2C family serine/threonine-protein phosphatase [Sorangium sp. So ce375]|uniref:PP2C family serine/threonine-protein phosphatase n=1 Tax=Sorangium sp. So ce375 TaxID=3133306 RepID=UPI003F5B5E57
MTGWLVFGASVRGPQHEQEGSPCQDVWAWGPAGERRVGLCLCDGAGSAAHPEIGAAAVAAAVVEALRELAPESPQALGDAVRAACAAGRQALLREADARALAPADLACTLVAVAAWGDAVAVAHLGDGAVVGRRRGGELVVLSAPDRGEYANETWFVSSPSWEARLRVGVHEGVDALCAFTDGCEGAALVRGRALAPYAPFCAPLLDFAAEVTDAGAASGEVARLLDAEPLRRSSGDDKTLAVALLRASP